ncbi:hypothetical protein LSCM1_05143 [Leishmania martiniquensis]|uniref:Phospholipase/carboxylesterase/thioesterase domain-containing protein n=1 Tax=Leishmania martiniquensis TaxID=1580590 RepID=A0A836GMG8_9TRYP|nr:hypothetical protein LSCM1_05143 [Leishmania martiniquensis]
MHREPEPIPINAAGQSPATLLKTVAMLLVAVAAALTTYPMIEGAKRVHSSDVARQGQVEAAAAVLVAPSTPQPPAQMSRAASPASDTRPLPPSSSPSVLLPFPLTPSAPHSNFDNASYLTSNASAIPAVLATLGDKSLIMALPTDQLTNAQMKEELRTSYGVTDFTDCIEHSDLQKKLQAIRDSAPITHGLRYGTLLEIGNENPTGVVTLIHGLGDSAYGWEDVGHELSRRLPHLLFLLPTAPSRRVTINGGMLMPAWYDIMDMTNNGLLSGRQDATSVRQSCDYVRSIAHVAAKKHGVALHRIVYGGFSQGAAISLCAGLTAHIAPAGIACMSGYLAACADVLPCIIQKAVPITMFHGRQDPVVPLSAARETKEILESKAGVTPISFLEYNMQHSTLPEEINDLAAFISRVLPAMF